MPSPTDSPRQPKPQGDARAAAARLGRRVAGGLYVVLCAYAIGAGLISVLPQIFWPAEAYGIAPADVAREDCPPALRALRAELLDAAADAVRDPGGGSMRPFLDGWDERHRALAPTCGDLPSYDLLARLRYGVEEHIQRFEAEEASLAAESLAAIDSDARASDTQTQPPGRD